MPRGALASCPHCQTPWENGHHYCSGCGLPVSEAGDEQDPFIGKTLPGGHLIVELVGSGGMGRVYRAEQRLLGRSVAVKVIHPHLVGDETIEARFINEARASSRLNHPNSVSIIDFGKAEGRLYLIMEFLRGRDLGTVMREQGLFSDTRIAEVLGQVLAALEEAHHLGIVHRDLKPENVILQSLRSGVDFVKVVDFGLAKLREQSPSNRNLTFPGMVCGTPQYMAPEQVRGEAVDGRADLYACGVMLFELLTGTLPFDAATAPEIAAMHLQLPPPDARVCAPERHIAPETAELVQRAMAKDPAARYQDAAQLAEALRSALLGEASPSGRHSGHRARCPSCHRLVRAGQKYCGECGAPMASSAPPAARDTPAAGLRMPAHAPLPRVSWASGPASQSGVLGRDEDLGWLARGRDEARSRLLARTIVAGPGFGKTRLLESFAAACRDRGDAVALCGPDPWHARVGYATLRQAIRQLVGVAAAAPDPTHWPGADAETRVALGQVFSTGSAHGADDLRTWSLAPPRAWKHGQRRALAAGALRWALGRASERTPDQVVVLLVDDLQTVDGASRHAITDVLAANIAQPVLVVAAHEPDFDPGWPQGESRALGGLGPDAEAALLDVLPRGSWPPTSSPRSQAGVRPPPQRPAPMWLVQLAHFSSEGGIDPPPRLADLVALRLERLPAHQRRVLQAVAVIGDSVPVSQLVAALSDVTGVSQLLGTLRDASWVSRTSDGTVSMHPLVREVTLGSMPAEVRRRLHARARQSAALVERWTPLEAHAQHATIAQQPFEALMLLEQTAARAAVRGDFEGSVAALRAGLELARHELAHGELDDPVGAALWFSCRLGDALALGGEPVQADGVLREALDLAGPAAPLRARLLASLANACFDRGRLALAHSTLEEARRLAAERGRKDWVVAFGRLRDAWAAEVGSHVGAAAGEHDG